MFYFLALLIEKKCLLIGCVSIMQYFNGLLHNRASLQVK